MKILITGGSGMLGSELLNRLAFLGHMGHTLDRKAYISADKMTRNAMLHGYDIIIHAAANTNVEQCEADPEKCYFDNTFLTETLVWGAYRLQSKFVFISSTGVYGRGKSTPFHEYDVPCPTTVHHRSKLMAEQVVLRYPKTLVLRTGWLFGGRLDNQKNFIANRIKEIRNSQGAIFANVVQTGSPTYVVDCANYILNLALDDADGVYNVVNEGAASRFEYVAKIAQLAGANTEVRPVNPSAFNRLADVSENESAVSRRLHYEGRPKLRSWQDALAEYMQKYNLLKYLGA